MFHQTLLCLTAFCASAIASDTAKVQTPPVSVPSQVIPSVKTTAYTHSEGDHLKYGSRTAAGTALQHGKVRSAAADWSVYPVGTVFQIHGDTNLYIVDDYGSALVGTQTIDLYKPSQALMNNWGVRRVNIRILKWGSYAKSLAILKPRQSKASHVREMVARLEGRPV